MSACPQPEQLQCLLCDEIAAEDRPELVKHIEGCAVCRQTLDELTDSSKLDELQFLSSLAPPRTNGNSRRFRLPPSFGELDESNTKQRPIVPGYEVLEKIGSGGMSVVWKARQKNLNRLVALKLIRSAAFADDEIKSRFLREAEAIAKLRHPGIVQIYEVGEADDCPYLALELIEGGNLRQLFKGKPAPPRLATELVRKLAEAVHCAHKHGVVHRDLKPSNVLISDCQLQSADLHNDSAFRIPNSGFVKIIDFGLAKHFDFSEHLTRTGKIMGTPAYMAPEQARGESRHVGPAADIHSLGVILYELLTGKLPFQGESEWDTLHQVVHSDASSLRSLNTQVPRDLDTVCLKCLEKDPKRRYATAQELADDLGRWLAGKPIAARRVSSAERLVRWCRRNRLATAFILVLLTATALSTFLVFQFVQISAQAEAARRKLEKQLYVGNIDRADRTWQADNVAGCLSLLQKCPVDLRNWEWRYLKRRCHAEIFRIQQKGAAIHTVAFHPDGKHIAAEFGNSIQFWNCVSRKLVYSAETQSTVQCLAMSVHGNFLASGEYNGTIMLWNAASGKPLCRLGEHKGVVDALAFSPDGKRLVSGGRDKKVKVWDLVNRKIIKTLHGHSVHVRGVAFHPGGQLIATAAGGHVDGKGVGQLFIWGRQKKPLQMWSVKDRTIASAAFHPNGRIFALASGGFDMRRAQGGRIQICDISSRNELRHIDCKGVIEDVAFSPEGDRLAVASRFVAHIFETKTGKKIRTIRGHTRPIRTVAFGPKARRIATAGCDEAVKVWDVTADQVARIAPFPKEHMYNHVAFHKNRLLAAAGASGKFYVFDLKKEKLIFTGNHFGKWRGTLKLAFAPNGEYLASASRNKTVKIWNKANGDEIRALPHSGVMAVCCNPSGDRLATAGDNEVIIVWNPKTGRKESVFHCPKQEIFSLCFSPDGKRLVSAGRTMKEIKRGIATVWDIQSGKILIQFKNHKNDINAAVFIPNTRLIATGGNDATVRIWNFDTGKERLVLKGHSMKISDVAVTPDGSRLATTSDDRTVCIWDVESGQRILEFKAHKASTASTAFSADGNLLATADWDGTVRIWDGRPLER